MKAIFLLKSLLFCTLLLSSCNKNDDDQCAKNENFFEAEFEGQIVEPRWITGGGSRVYTLYINRNQENRDDWAITITAQNNIVLTLSLMNIVGEGNYPVNTGNENDLPIPPPFFRKTFILLNQNVGDPSSYYFSLENTGSIEVTDYNSETGILVGSFRCELYSSLDPSIILPIEGAFNINLSTLDINMRPCWL